MRFRMTGKKLAQIAGCAVFCLAVCVTAFRNRTLVLEPAAEFLRGGSGFQDMTRTVRDNYLSDRFREKSGLITLNGGYARLQGRTLYNEVQVMTNGMLTSTTASMMKTSDFSENLSRFSRWLEDRGIPFLFVMAPFKLPTEENLLPAGAEDRANDIANQAMAELAELGVPTLDLRKEISRNREQIEKYFYRTDHHWNADGAFRAFQLLMEAIRGRFPETRTTCTDAALWEKTVKPDWWLGSDGRRVGPLFGGTDDLDYILPAFETEMSRYSIGVWTCHGDFREANMREWLMERSDLFEMDSYSRYVGGPYAQTLHRNLNAENHRRLTIIRDSFMLPLECFLSTEFTSLDVIDPRTFPLAAGDYVALNPTDMVIMMIYPEVLPSAYYPYYFPKPGGEPEITAETCWDGFSVSGDDAEADYAALPARLEGGRSYILTLEGVDVKRGTPDGANIVLYRGDTEADQTVFDIGYGNRYGFQWGFRIPENGEGEGDYELRFYAGVRGGTEGMELEYRGIRLQECELRKP